MKEFIDKLKSRLKEKLLEYINKANDEMIEKGHTLDFENFLGHKEAYENVLYDIVNQLAEEYKGGWIPCSEENLPGDREEILVTTDNGGCVTAWYLNYYNNWVNSSTGNEIKAKVIAWQPLPQAYKEGE